ncbi:MAG: hypothetical protein DRO04_00290 [Candidatus Iainarchaeum archaeon]|uniref:Uncharacterized protein n=1 Tax=Candidatus Iainarchaeum sp. TaxID=3101447 RepID=A0A497JJ74_9ARCH|nr:MAG: hypothetical protein DRO04_00290 [Candidatus Diapherotrites archaeon]
MLRRRKRSGRRKIPEYGEIEPWRKYIRARITLKELPFSEKEIVSILQALCNKMGVKIPKQLKSYKNLIDYLAQHLALKEFKKSAPADKIIQQINYAKKAITTLFKLILAYRHASREWFESKKMVLAYQRIIKNAKNNLLELGVEEKILKNAERKAQAF